MAIISTYQIIAEGKQISGWKIDENGYAGVLLQSPVTSEKPESNLILVPMGGARLRISAFPVIEQ